MKQIYFKNLLLLLLFFAVAAQNLVKAQGNAVLTTDGAVIPAGPNTLNVHYDDGEFKITILLGEASVESEFKITMPPGFEFVAGTGTLAGSPIVEETSSTSSEVVFLLNLPASTPSVSAVEVTFRGKANCEAIAGSGGGRPLPRVLYSLQHYEVDDEGNLILDDDNNPIEDGPPSAVSSNGINILFANLNLAITPSPTPLGIGEVSVRTITINNTGTGTIDEFTLIAGHGSSVESADASEYPKAPAGWVRTALPEGSPDGKTFRFKAAPGITLAAGASLTIEDQVTLIDCVPGQLSTIYEVFYGGDVRCTTAGVDATATAIITYRQAGAPSIQRTSTTATPNPILCLDQEVEYTVVYKNTGNAALSSATVFAHVSASATSYSTTGSNGFLAHLKESDVRFRKSMTGTFSGAFTTVAPSQFEGVLKISSIAGGFSEMPSRIGIPIDILEPGESVEVKFVVVFKEQSPTLDCANVPTMIIPAVNTRMMGMNAAACPTPTTATEANGYYPHRAAQSFASNVTNYGENDVLAGPYKIDVLLSAAISANTDIGPVSNNSFYDIVVTLPDAFAPVSLDASNIFLTNEGTAIPFDEIIQDPSEPGVYRLRIKKGHRYWSSAANSSLNIPATTRLTFNTIYTCPSAAPFDAWFKIGGELNFNNGDPDCSPLRFKCTTVTLNNEVCIGTGDCDAGGFMRLGAGMYRVNFGTPDFDNDGIPDRPTNMTIEEILAGINNPADPNHAYYSTINIRAFVGMEEVELFYNTRVANGTKMPAGGWTQGFISYQTPNALNMQATRGRLTITRAGITHVIDYDASEVTKSGNSFRLSFDATDSRFAALGYKFEHDDLVDASIFVRTTGHPSNNAPTHYVFEGDVALTVGDTPYNCGFPFTATGIYNWVQAYIENGGNASLANDCATQVGGARIGFRLNGGYGDGVFVNEFRQFTSLDNITIEVPEGLEMIGINLRGQILSGTTAQSVGVSANGPFNIDLQASPIQGGAAYTFNLNAAVAQIRQAAAGQPNDANIEGGFFVNVYPVVRPVCNDPQLVNGQIKISGTYKDGPFTETLDGPTAFTKNVSTLTVNYLNNNLKITVPQPIGQINGNKITWLVQASTGGTRSYSNVWLSVDNLPPGATLASIEQISSLSHTAAGTDILGAGDFAEIGNFGTNTNRYYRVVIELDEDCSVHTLDLVWGSGCDGYPTDLASATCLLGRTTGLTYQEFSPQVQTVLARDAGLNTRPDICDPLVYHLTFSNPGNASAANLQFAVSMPTGALQFVENSFFFINSAGVQIGEPIPNDHVQPSGSGFVFSLPADTELAPGEPIHLSFSVKPDACNFRSGEYLRIEPTASNVCGDPLAGASLQGVTSQRINIFGVPTNEPALRITSSIDNVVLGPVNSTTAAVTADYTFRLTNTAPGSVALAADDYRFKIALPEGWTMRDLVYTTNPVGLPSDAATAIPVPDANGVYTFLDWNNNLGVGQYIEFTAKIDLSPEVAKDLECGEEFVITESTGLVIDISDCAEATACPFIDHIIDEHDVRANIPAVIIPVPEPIQEFCDTRLDEDKPTLADLLIDVSTVRYLKWYSNAAGTVEIPATTRLVDGQTYYARNFLLEDAVCSSDVVAITPTVHPLVELESPVETECVTAGYILSFTVTGTPFTGAGVDPFTIVGLTGGTWEDNGDDTYTYVSDLIGLGVPYAITVSDANNCEALVIEGDAPACFLNLEGTVFNDVNGLTDGAVNGDGINSIELLPSGTAPLYVNLLDENGLVIAITTPDASGHYIFAAEDELIVPENTYFVQVSTVAGTVGQPAPTTSLPENWVLTGEHLGAGPGDDGLVDGLLEVTVGFLYVTDANMALQHLPAGTGDIAPSQINPGGTNNAIVPADIFGGTDAHGGIIEAIIFKEFPSNVTSITIDGETFTDPTTFEQDFESRFPNGIPTDEDGLPTVVISIDPVDGDVVVDMPYVVVDNAGFESVIDGLAQMPFEGRKPEISVTKSVSELDPDPTVFPLAGDQITYTFLVKNEGNVPLFAVELLDFDFDGDGVNPMVPIFVAADGSPASPEGTLKVGETATYQVVYTLVQHDVDQGELNNKVRADGEDQIPGWDPTPVTDEDDEHIDLPHNPLVELTKAGVYTGADPERAEVGDLIEYTFVVTNTGNVTLYDIKINDDQFSGTGEAIVLSTPVADPMTNSAAALAPNGTLTYTASYAITQDDIDAGEVVNQALVRGTPPLTNTPIEDLSDDPNDPTDDDPNIPGNPDDPTIVELPRVATVELTKAGIYTGDPDRAEVGDIIEYTFVVTNTGNVTLKDVVVDDENPFFSGTGELILSEPVADPTTSSAASLAPYATLTYTASYAITQEDIDAGLVENQALVSGNSPIDNDPVTDLSDDPNDPTDDDQEGDGEPDDPTIVPLPQDPLVDLTKAAVYTGDPERAKVGDIIEYTFVVTNTGNVTLADVQVDETLMFSGTGDIPTLSAPIANPSTSSAAALAPYATLTYTASYAITQEDINAGEVINQAIVRGTPPNTNTPIEDHSDDPNDPTDVDPDGDGNPDDPTIVPLPQDPLIDLIKSAIYHGEPFAAEVGDLIDYTFVVTNTGNVTLYDIRITDDILFSGTGIKPVLSAPVASSPHYSESFLEPRATLTYTASYAITQEDIDAGHVTNQALVKGTPPNTNTPIEDHSDDPDDPTDVDPDGDGNPDDPTVVDFGQNPILELLKSGTYNDENGDGFAQVGETITYTFTVHNRGNVTVTNLVIDDATIGVSGLTVRPSSLRPGETGTATYKYAVNQAEIDAGGVWNIATVTGEDPTGDPVTDDSEDPNPLDPNDEDFDPDCEDCTFTPLPQTGAYTIIKTADKAEVVKAGERIKYTIQVTNTGNITLHNVTVTDILFPDWSATVPTLAPQYTETFELTYTVTQADIDAGKILNVATVTGEEPDGTPLDPEEDDEEVPVKSTPAISVTKTADKDVVRNEGETITYTIVVKNTGNTTLTNVRVEDPLTGLSQVIATLAVGEEQRFTTTYQVRPTDFAMGRIVNVVTAKGEDPTGKPVEDEDEETVPVDPEEFKIPNVFTPNGDGFNDNFEIKGIERYDRIEILIFNRWGNEVYRSDNYKNDWSGRNLNEGTYYYVINAYKSGRSDRYAGWVLLKRN